MKKILVIGAVLTGTLMAASSAFAGGYHGKHYRHGHYTTYRYGAVYHYFVPRHHYRHWRWNGHRWSHRWHNPHRRHHQGDRDRRGSHRGWRDRG